MTEIVDVANSINLILLFLFALLVVYIYLMLKVIKNIKIKPKEKKKKSKTHETTQDEFEQILMKLFTVGIISQQEYNRILVNGLPHFK